jgi:hypothetical protein
MQNNSDFSGMFKQIVRPFLYEYLRIALPLLKRVGIQFGWTEVVTIFLEISKLK